MVALSTCRLHIWTETLVATLPWYLWLQWTTGLRWGRRSLCCSNLGRDRNKWNYISIITKICPNDYRRWRLADLHWNQGNDPKHMINGHLATCIYSWCRCSNMSPHQSPVSSHIEIVQSQEAISLYRWYIGIQSTPYEFAATRKQSVKNSTGF